MYPTGRNCLSMRGLWLAPRIMKPPSLVVDDVFHDRREGRVWFGSVRSPIKTLACGIDLRQNTIDYRP